MAKENELRVMEIEDEATAVVNEMNEMGGRQIEPSKVFKSLKRKGVEKSKARNASVRLGGYRVIGPDTEAYRWRFV